MLQRNYYLTIPQTEIMLRFFLTMSGVLLHLLLSAQPASVQDCLGAIPVCQQIYEETQAPFGNGNVTDFAPGDNCLPGEVSSIWYTFKVNNSGDFGFLLTPNNPDQDYDWVLYDITNANCQDIYNNPSLVVSCNAAGNTGCHGPTGANGDTEFDNQGSNCGNLPPTMSSGFSPFNDLVPVVANNTYVLCILNFSFNSSEGYTLDFGLSGGIGIYDDIPPTLDSVDYPESCNGQEILVRFSEFIQCSTIDETNFQLSGQGGPYTLTMSSSNCDAGGNYSKEFTLMVSPYISPGDQMSLSLVVDGITEVLDLCGNPAASQDLSFGDPTITELLNLGSDTSICSGSMIILDPDYSGGYMWSDGSSTATFEILEEGTYWLSINTPCGITSDTIEVTYLSTSLPVDALGNDTTLCTGESLLLELNIPDASYEWQDGSTDAFFMVDQPGTYSVLVSNECGTAQSEIMIDFAEPMNIPISEISICDGEIATIDVTTVGAEYLWQDGSTDPVFLTSSSGIYSVTITNPCEILELSIEVLETATTLPSFNLGNDTTLCTGESLLLELNIPDVSYEWQDGSTNAFFMVDQPGTYSVLVSNECGTAQSEIMVDFAEPLSVELVGEILCFGETISWDVIHAGATYLWQDGSTSPIYVAMDAGDYSVTVTSKCEEVFSSVTIKECELCNVYIPNAFSPNFDGSNDYFQPYLECEIEQYNMKIFNRWGAFLFESTSYENTWDGKFKGKIVENGVYVYLIQLSVLEDGEIRKIDLSGDITITK